MSVRPILGAVALAVALGTVAGTARGQGPASLADEIIVISSGEKAKQQQRDATHLGPIHGSVERPFGTRPGLDESRLGGQLPERRPLDVLQAASRPIEAGTNVERYDGIAPPALPPQAGPELPLHGLLPASAIEDEGPPGGLTLEQAIARLVAANPDLAVKFQELPKAEADILTAGLWGNPLVFASASGIPYGSYTPRRPGSNGYSITLVQPFDVNGKIRARSRLAQAGKEVLGAQYQDAVRLEVENLHAAYVDVLAARTTLRYMEASVANVEELVAATEERVKRGALPDQDLDGVLIERESALNALDEAAVRVRQAKRRLAVLLGVPAAQADAIEPLGTLRDRGPAPPPPDQLVQIALSNRPDLAAFRLGVRSAAANAALQRRERFPDVFALYTPYEFSANNDVQSARSATAWGAGIFATVPIANRNQGNIRRADRNVLQTKMEVAALEEVVAAEVENAALEYGATRRVVERIEATILPRAAHRVADFEQLYEAGERDLEAYLDAQRAYNGVVRDYRDALVRHRRAMLALNTAVGVRLLP